MRKRKPKAVFWNEVKDSDGSLLGEYAVNDGMIRVRKATGGEKTTRASGADDNEGLARLILSETTGWPKGRKAMEDVVFIPKENADSANAINPVQGERGKYYYAINCGNKQCGERLLVTETPPRAPSDVAEAIKAKVIGRSIRCFCCTKNTLIEDRAFIFMEIR